MSEICATSSRAATRGATFLPMVVAGASSTSYFCISGTIRLPVSSARRSFSCGASASSTLRTPASLAASSATPPAFSPAIRISTSPPNFAAASSTLAVAGARVLLSCSARSRTAILENSRLVLQLLDEGGDAVDLDARLAPLWLGDAEHLEPRRDVDAERLWRRLVDRLLLGLHDVGQRSVARLVEPEVRGDHRGARKQQGLEPAIDLAHHAHFAVGEFDLRGEGALRPAEQTSQHLARLIGVVVDRLLAHDDEVGLLVLDHALQHLGDAKRLDQRIGLHQNGAVGAHGERGAKRVLRFDRADRHGDHLGRLPALLDANRLFDGDLVERVHRHLDVGEVDPGAVRLDANLDVEVDDTLHRNENLHAAILSRTCFCFPPNAHEARYLASARWPGRYCRQPRKSMVSRLFERL